MNMIKINLLVLLSVAMTIKAQSQDFAIKRVELAGDKINLYYDLLDSVKGRTYTIDLYSSKDNFISRLENVSGDIGLEVKPGGNHKITWNAREDLGLTFQGKVGLEVRGRVYIPFVRLDGLNKMYKRGKEYQLSWRGGSQQNILNFELYKGDEMKYSIPNVANVGQTTIKLPRSVKPGKGYYFKITDNKNKDQIVNTTQFVVKRKIPLLIQVIPFIAIGGAAAALAGGTSDSGVIPDPLSPVIIH